MLAFFCLELGTALDFSRPIATPLVVVQEGGIRHWALGWLPSHTAGANDALILLVLLPAEPTRVCTGR